MNEYPKYELFQKTDAVEQEECWKKYSNRIKKIKSENKEIQYPLDKNAYTFYPQHEYHKCLVTDITPKKFLELSKPKATIRACSLDYLLDAFEYNAPTIPPVYLSIDPSNCVVNGHEGRHRAEIANDLDIDKIPISICYYGDYTLLKHDKEFRREAVDYDAIHRANNEMKNVYKKEKKGNLYDTLLKNLKDKWKTPNNCTINNLKKEGKSIFDSSLSFSDIEEKREMYRKKYGLEK